MTNNSPVVLLDGAMGTALRARGVRVADYKSSAWSAFALLDSPEIIQELHADYIRAGSRVITANNYAVTSHLLGRANIQDRQIELLNIAVDLAICARKDAGISCVKVAVSLPPLNTSYRADLVGDSAEMLAEYREIVKASQSKVDLYICETMTTISESIAAATAGCESGVDTWLSMTLEPETGRLRGGELIENLINAVADLPIKGFLFNCADCDTVTRMLPELKAMVTTPVGAYCNPVLHEPKDNGEPEQVINKLLSAREYADITRQWTDLGATLIGGCCDTDPDYIRSIHEQL